MRWCFWQFHDRSLIKALPFRQLAPHPLNPHPLHSQLRFADLPAPDWAESTAKWFTSLPALHWIVFPWSEGDFVLHWSESPQFCAIDVICMDWKEAVATSVSFFTPFLSSLHFSSPTPCCSFLAVQNSSIGDLVTHSLSHSLSHVYFCHTKSNPRRLLPLRHLIRVLRRQFLMTIFDDNFWWQFSMTISMTIFDDNF